LTKNKLFGWNLKGSENKNMLDEGKRNKNLDTMLGAW